MRRPVESATALLSYLNHRFIGLPTTIGVMGIALLLSFALFGLDVLGFGALHDSEISLLSSVDFSEFLLQGLLSLCCLPAHCMSI